VEAWSCWVFETLNDRGIGLSTPDLLRNLLLRRAPDEDTRKRIVAAWQTVLAINEEASVDEFIRHYWVSHRGDVKARKLYREIKDKVINENIESLALRRRPHAGFKLDRAMRSETVAVGCHRLPIGLFAPFLGLCHLRPVATGCAR
jgi:hypothetical protein